MRLGGIQYYADQGVDPYKIQALARHSGTAVLRYLESHHHASTRTVSSEAVLAQDLSTVRRELRSLRYQRERAERIQAEMALADEAATSGTPLLPASRSTGSASSSSGPFDCPPSTTTYVLNTRKGGRLHNADPRRPGRTFCDWHWHTAAHAQPCSSPFRGVGGALRPAVCQMPQGRPDRRPSHGFVFIGVGRRR